MSFKPKKAKVVEVLSLHCLDREPRPGFLFNRWVARVRTEPPDRSLVVRTVTLLAKDELEAFTKLITEGA